jgi:leucyl/phenylalanyl-tRNA--protein transferase
LADHRVASSCPDTQYVTGISKTFGAVEIARRRYTVLLDRALTGAR